MGFDDEEVRLVSSVGIAGGTGALGRGLALRLAAGGVPVRIGSRDEQRGRAAAEDVTGRLGEGAAEVVGGANAAIAERDVVVLAVPFESVDATLEVLAGQVASKVVVSAVNPLGFDAGGPYPVEVAEGCVAELVAAALPDARVVAAFHTLSSHRLNRLEQPMDDDVVVLGDDGDAVELVVDLADRMAGCRGVPGGRLRLARTLESLTPVLISVNQRLKAHAGVRLTGLPGGRD